jgi:hypothetical protein
MEPLSRARASPEGCRVIAFDRPPFGLTERPLQWAGGAQNSPYSARVRRCSTHCRTLDSNAGRAHRRCAWSCLAALGVCVVTRMLRMIFMML